MARGDRQAQTATVPLPVPDKMPPHPVEERSGAHIPGLDDISQGPAVDALLHQAKAYENEAVIAERNAARFRESAEDHGSFAARCRANAAACRDAIQRLSN